MMTFLKTKTGLMCVGAFVLLMAVVTHHVGSGARRRPAAGQPYRAAVAAVASPSVAASPASIPPSVEPVAGEPPAPAKAAGSERNWAPLAENVAYLESYYGLDRTQHEDHDRQGNPVTRRVNAPTPNDAGHGSTMEEALPSLAPQRGSTRLQGRPAPGASLPGPAPTAATSDAPVRPTAPPPAAVPPPDGPGATRRPVRFNPYGSVIKCELVFTLDSTNEQTPLVGMVMEPVYNNGALVVPAGAELHGFARPDRLRDRIFSDQEWVLVFPRERQRPNGRQLNVRGVALDRVEPDANGMTWGITDGSYGLAGRVIRSLNDAEIKRFVATFLAAGSAALEQREPAGRGRESVSATPRNAVLEGLGANLEQVAADISAEIAAHGVFIRVPAGHQFYFYPLQLIDADAADISSDVATVK